MGAALLSAFAGRDMGSKRYCILGASARAPFAVYETGVGITFAFDAKGPCLAYEGAACWVQDFAAVV